MTSSGPVMRRRLPGAVSRSQGAQKKGPARRRGQVWEGGSRQETRERAGVALGGGEAFEGAPSLVPDTRNMAVPASPRKCRSAMGSIAGGDGGGMDPHPHPDPLPQAGEGVTAP